MFYDYLKSIYNIMEKYDTQSDKFQNMLDLNDNFIRDIDKKSYNRQSVKSGGKMRMISIAAFNKQIGGDHFDDIQIMKKAITEMIDKLNNKEGNVVDLSRLKTKIEKFKSVMTKMVEYIELLHSTGPGSDRMSILSEQLKQIKNILEKY